MNKTIKELIRSKATKKIAVIKFDTINNGTLYTSYYKVAVVDGQAEFTKNKTLGDTLTGDDARNAVADKCMLSSRSIYDWNNGKVLAEMTPIVSDITIYDGIKSFDMDQWGGEWEDSVTLLEEVEEYGDMALKALIKMTN